MPTEYLDRPPPGWFVLDVMRAKARSRHWTALMLDVDPDNHPKQWPPDMRSAFVRIPGKHQNRDAAWDALEDMRATRH